MTTERSEETTNSDLDEEFILKGNQPAVATTTADRIVVDAGAGTGKTTTMVARIEALLEAETVTPDEILVLTFANKAAHGAIDRLTDSLSGTDAFDIDAYTYHSFCYGILREYAYAVGMSPDFELLTDDRQRAIIGSIHDSLTFTHTTPERATAADLTKFIETFRNAGIGPDTIEETLPDPALVSQLATIVRELKQTADQQFGADSEGSLAFRSKNGHPRLVKRLERFKNVLSYQRSLIDTSDPFGEHVQTYLSHCLSIVETLITVLPDKNDDWSRVPSGLFGTWSGVHGASLKDTKQTPISRLDSLLELFARAHTFCAGYRQYEQVLTERDAIDYAGLIRRTTELLESDLGTDICDRYTHIFCDEFQDTDSAQLSLVAALSADQSVFVIGDADQAIYEWRGADPTNITDIASVFPTIEPMELDLNFRSYQPILDLSNALPGSTKTLQSTRGTAPNSVLTVSADREKPIQASQVSSTVSNLLTGGFEDIETHNLGDIAILVRQNYEADLICAALADDSIPYTRSGGTHDSMPVGITTLLAYLRVLVDPTDDRSLIRVLKLVYRIPDSDIRILARQGETVIAGLREAVDSLAHPDRATRALNDITELTELRRSSSLSALYGTLCTQTKIKWTFTDRDRALIPALESRIDAFSETATDGRLTAGFIRYLDDPAALESARTLDSNAGEKSENAVDVMTVHQAKGLDFPVVLLPFLGPSWAPPPSFNLWRDTSDWSVLEQFCTGSLASPLIESLSDTAAAEQWRVLHVAITRARDRLVLFGNSETHATVHASALDPLLPTGIGWSHGGASVDTWAAVSDAIESLTQTEAVGAEADTDHHIDTAKTEQEDHKGAVTDITTAVEVARKQTPEQITWYDGSTVSADRAISEIRSLTRSIKDGTISIHDSQTETRYNAVPSQVTRSDSLPRIHSHTALETFGDCSRKHYLDHVVYGISDPVATDSETDDSVPWQEVGTLFHHVAEDAYWRSLTTQPQWNDACDRLAREHGLQSAVPHAKQCIERYFQSEVTEWELKAVEVPFSLDHLAERSGADAVTGYIDAVYKNIDDELVVLDYKSTDGDRSLETSYQLVLYLLAADARFSEQVAGAGYLSLGASGPTCTVFDRQSLLAQIPSLMEQLSKATNSTYYSTTPGTHCRYCPHRSLGCGPADDEPL